MTENEKLIEVIKETCLWAHQYDAREIEVEKTTEHMKIKVRVKR